MTVVVFVVVAVVVVLAVVLARRPGRRFAPSDGVAQFRRQIDALSPEARRPVVDQVQALEEESRRAAGRRAATRKTTYERHREGP